MTPFSVLLFAVTLAGGVTAQYPNYFLPQTYSYPSFPISNGYTFPQYAIGGAQYGYPMQMQQPFYGGYTMSPSLSASPLMGGMDPSTIMAAQTTTAVLPNQGVAMVATPAVGQAVISPQQIYQAGTVVTTPVVTGQPVVQPGTSVVQSNTVEVLEEQPQKNPGHFDYYAYGRDGLDKEGRNVQSRRPYYQATPPNYIRNGSPIRVTKPDHFEYVTYGRSDPIIPYTP